MASNFANTVTLVEIKEIRDNTVIMKSGRMLHVLMVDGVNFSLKSEEEQNIIIYGYQNFLNGLDFPVHILVHSRKINIESYLAKLKDTERNESSPLLRNQISEYHQFIASFVVDNAIMEKTFFVVVPYSPMVLPTKENVQGLTRFLPFLKKKDARAEAETEALAEAKKNLSFTDNLTQLTQRTEQVMAGLRTIGLELTQLKNDELVALFYNFYNPEAVERESMHLASAEGG